MLNASLTDAEIAAICALQAASKLLQHGNIGTTRQSYRRGDKLKPVR